MSDRLQTLLILLLPAISFFLHGCAKPPLAGYERLGRSSRYAGDISAQGKIDIICLDDCPTLFQCLVDARTRHPESIIFPKNASKLYLGHIAKLITRTLRFYHLERSFQNFHGYRILLRFRKLSQEEKHLIDMRGYRRLAVTASLEASLYMNAFFIPTTPFHYLYDSLREEKERQEWIDYSSRNKLPEPDRSGFEIVFRKYKGFVQKALALLWGTTPEIRQQGDMDQTVNEFIVTRCRVTPTTPAQRIAWDNTIP